MLTWRFPHLSTQVALDLGSQWTRVWSEAEPQTKVEATCLAIDQRSQRVLAIGTEAVAMEGRVADHIKVLYPMHQGVVHDADALRAYLQILLPRVLGQRGLFRPVVMVSVAAGATQAHKQALTEVLYDVGAREVFTMSQPLAAAIGAGVPIADASGSFFCQLGNGRVEAAVISLGSSVLSHSSTRAGAELDQRIIQVVGEECALGISASTAQELKHKVAGIAGLSRSWLVSGRDTATGAPKELKVDTQQLLAAVQPVAQEWVSLLQKVLSELPPELTVDAIDKGMLLSGGLSQLAGLDEWLVGQLGVPVAVVDQPELVVVRGLQTALEHLEEFRQSLAFQSK